MLGHSSGFGFGLRPLLKFKSFCLGQVSAKPKAKKWIKDTIQRHPLDSVAGFEFSEGCGSTSALQFAPTSSGLSFLTSPEFSFLPEDTSPCLMAGLEDAVVVSGLVALSSFGAAVGRVLVTCATPGLSSLVATDGPSLGPIPASSGPEYLVIAFGSASSSATSGSASLVARSGYVLTSSDLVLQSSLVVDAGFECSLGIGSTSDLQRPPTSPEKSKGAELHEGAGSTSLAADLSVSEVPANWAVGSAPSPCNGCAAAIAEKGANIRSDGLTHS